MIRTEVTGDLKAFFALSERAGYARSERQYIERYFALNGRRGAYLIASEDNVTLARVMTWTDAAYTFTTGDMLGFFALLDGEERAFGPLIEKIESLQRAWGMEALLGPVAPDGSGWFMGQCDRSCAQSQRGLFSGPGDRGQTRALTEAGYSVRTRFGAYLCAPPAVNQIRQSAERFAGRLKLALIRPSLNPFDQELSRAAYALSPNNKTDAALRVERLRGFIARRHTFIVKNAAGGYTGYAIGLKGEGTERVATIMTADDQYRRPTVALLASALIDSFRGNSASGVELSVIDADNEASNRLVIGLGAVHARNYLLYYKKIT